MVRYAAVHALGPYNGSVVVADVKTGRILTMVNQKLAFSDGFQPCSTIKLVTAFAGLNEHAIGPDFLVRTGARRTIGLTQAMAHSSNTFFAQVGSKVGFDAFLRYARLFGLGERAGLNIGEESPGILPGHPPLDSEGGTGIMTTYGLSISVTPLQLTALVSAIANGGTLYYLQYPRTEDEQAHFTPRVKRRLDIATFLPDVKAGMLAAVTTGTARRANIQSGDQILGKTGTCTDAQSPTHLGWFASFNQGTQRSIVVVVLLTGGWPANGPLASSIAGSIYRTLSEDHYFGSAAGTVAFLPAQPRR